MLSLLLSCASLAIAADPIRPYPLPDASLQTTSILNHSQYLKGIDDQQWYLDNIPFVDFPDQSTNDVYYYRASVVKRHLKYAHEGHGWLFTEFIHPVAWASKFQTIPDSAGHQILEARWLRDPRYVKDNINLYARAGAETISGVTYTHFVHQAILEHAQVTGDTDLLQAQLEGMIHMYGLWNTTLDPMTGLYHRTPLLDAQEFSLPGYLVGGPNGGPVEAWNSFENDYQVIDLGPETFRPSFNAYMVAASRTISQVASMAGNTSLADRWNATSTALYQQMQDRLYDRDINFWIDVIQEANLPAIGRQQIGYYPYRFGLGTSDSDVQGLEAGLDTEHFLTEFGPTTLEQTNPYYSAFKNLTYCCIWQGQSWPFSTSVFLGTLARLARENRSSVATPEFFQQAFNTYTHTNYKDGRPYTAESHYPTIDEWSADTTNHSENYLHSTYMDNVFTNLLGVVPTFDSRLEMRPLIPSNWTHFAVENMPYHGFLISVLWDANGSQYSSQPHEAGLTVYTNGQMLHHQADLSFFNVTLPSSTPTSVQTLATAPTYENILANPNAPHGFPSISADYTFASNGDVSPYEAWKLNDGLLWYDATPDNRWTNNQTSSAYSTINVTLPRARTFSSMSFAVYTDVDEANPDDPAAIGRIIDCPGGIQIKDARTDLVVAERNPWMDCERNALNTIAFSRPSANPSNMTTPTNGTSGQNVTTDKLTVTVLNKRYRASAFSELQIWTPTTPGPPYEVEDGLLGTFIGGFEGRARGFNGSIMPESRVGAADGGVRLGESGWVEVAGVQYNDGAGGQGSMTISGSGKGRATVQMNFMRNYTVSFDGDDMVDRRLDGVKYLRGPNVVTIFGEEGSVFVDAFEVG